MYVPSPKDNIVFFFHKYMSSYHVCKDSKSTLNRPRLNCVTKTCNYLRRRNASPIDSGVTVMFELLAQFFNYTHEVMMIFKRQKFTIAFLFWMARYSVSLMMILAILKNLFFVIIKSFSGQLPFVLFKLKFFLLHGKLMDVRNKISHFPYRLMIILKTCCKNKARWIGYAIKTHIIIALKAIS